MMRREMRSKKQEAGGKKGEKLNLERTQRLVAQMVMRPLTKDYEMQKKWVDGRPMGEVAAMVIKPNDRLTSFERLEIYNKQYWFRVMECFGDDFPGLRGVLGEKKFDRLTVAYLEARPSRSFTLRNLGQFLVAFLQERPELTAPYAELALDMARFEWAQVQAFDERAYPALTPTDLAAVSANPARAKLYLQPYIQLLELQYPLDDFLLALKKKNGALRSEASNAMEEPGKRKRTQEVRRPRREQVYLAVHRFDNSLYYKRLTAEAFYVLRFLREGESLERAVTRGISMGTTREEDWGATIRGWFETWTQLGWFCSPRVT